MSGGRKPGRAMRSAEAERKQPPEARFTSRSMSEKERRIVIPV